MPGWSIPSYKYCPQSKTNHIGSLLREEIIYAVKKAYKMKIIALVLCFAVGVLAQDKYANTNDDFDISEVLDNERLLNSYAKCLLNKGPCTPEIKSVKGKKF